MSSLYTPSIVVMSSVSLILSANSIQDFWAYSLTTVRVIGYRLPRSPSRNMKTCFWFTSGGLGHLNGSFSMSASVRVSAARILDTVTLVASSPTVSGAGPGCGPVCQWSMAKKRRRTTNEERRS